MEAVLKINLHDSAPAFAEAFYSFMNITVRNVEARKSISGYQGRNIGSQCMEAMELARRRGTVTLTNFKGDTLTIKVIRYVAMLLPVSNNLK